MSWVSLSRTDVDLLQLRLTGMRRRPPLSTRRLPALAAGGHSACTTAAYGYRHASPAGVPRLQRAFAQISRQGARRRDAPPTDGHAQAWSWGGPESRVHPEAPRCMAGQDRGWRRRLGQGHRRLWGAWRFEREGLLGGAPPHNNTTVSVEMDERGTLGLRALID